MGSFYIATCILNPSESPKFSHIPGRSMRETTLVRRCFSVEIHDNVNVRFLAVFGGMVEWQISIEGGGVCQR